MPDTIRPRDRALIDAELAAGRVTVCPAGWARAELEAVPVAEQIRRAVVLGRAQRAAALRGRTDPVVEVRRARVDAARQRGMSRREIAESLGLPTKTVDNDLTTLRKRREVGL